MRWVSVFKMAVIAGVVAAAAKPVRQAFPG